METPDIKTTDGVVVVETQKLDFGLYSVNKKKGRGCK